VVVAIIWVASFKRPIESDETTKHFSLTERTNTKVVSSTTPPRKMIKAKTDSTSSAKPQANLKSSPKPVGIPGRGKAFGSPPRPVQAQPAQVKAPLAEACQKPKPQLVALPNQTDPTNFLVEKKAPKNAECSRYGTAVDFVDSPAEAARKALKEHKLVFVLHVAGNFEDDKFT
jgi:hypothetical protein